MNTEFSVLDLAMPFTNCLFVCAVLLCDTSLSSFRSVAAIPQSIRNFSKTRTELDYSNGKGPIQPFQTNFDKEKDGETKEERCKSYPFQNTLSH